MAATRPHDNPLSSDEKVKFSYCDPVKDPQPKQPAPHIGAGWSIEVVTRGCGIRKDRYFYSPSGEKLRSMAEVRRYLDATELRHPARVHGVPQLGIGRYHPNQNFIFWLSHRKRQWNGRRAPLSVSQHARAQKKSPNERIKDLISFYNEHGEWPKEKANKSLHTFCTVLRGKRREGKLSGPDIASLNVIGFIWEILAV